MSECHDLYDAVPAQPSPLVATEGTQCHDPYPSAPVDGATHTSPAHECRLVRSHNGPVRLVRVMGHLDWTSAARFGELMRHDCTDRQVIIDLSSTVSDSAGTGSLLSATVRAKAAHQQLVFVVSDPQQLEVLQYVGLDRVMPVVASEAAAFAWLGAQPAAVDTIDATT